MGKSECFNEFGRAVHSEGKIKSHSRKDVVCKTGNSKVLSHKDKTTYILHDCPIVRVDKKRKIAKLSSCGWHTPTTKSHMNGALREVSDKSVVQKKGKWSVNGEDFHDNIPVKIN